MVLLAGECGGCVVWRGVRLGGQEACLGAVHVHTKQTGVTEEHMIGWTRDRMEVGVPVLL